MSVVFHLLDIQSRDICIESEKEDTVELVYESPSDDDEYQPMKKKKGVSTSKQRELVIHLFGATETGIPVRCDVTGFRPTFYVRLPEEKTSAAADSIKQYINRQGIPMGQINITRVTKKIFYGFTAQTFYPFLQIDVPSLNLFRTLKGLFLDENLNPSTKRPLDAPLHGKKVEVFEANLDPMLRFLHCQNIQPCGWVTVTDGKSSIISETDSSLIMECDYQQILPTQGPRVSAPFVTASWDIECFSMTGDFPVAKRSWNKAAKDLIAPQDESIGKHIEKPLHRNYPCIYASQRNDSHLLLPQEAQDTGHGSRCPSAHGGRTNRGDEARVGRTGGRGSSGLESARVSGR